MERTSLTNSARPFSFRSMTTTLLGLKQRTALIKEEPIDPAPPITQTDLPLISLDNWSLFASISLANRLTGLNVTLSAINLLKLNISYNLSILQKNVPRTDFLPYVIKQLQTHINHDKSMCIPS